MIIKTHIKLPTGGIQIAENPAPLVLPVLGRLVRAGFPSPADDYVEDGLDLNQLMIEHKAATFFCRARGTSMEGAGIMSGDILVVDRAITAITGNIVVAAVDGELVVKRLMRQGNRVWLESASPNYAPIFLQEGQDLQVWGVVTGVVRRFRR